MKIINKSFVFISSLLVLLLLTTNVFAYSLEGGKFPDAHIHYAIANAPSNYIKPIEDGAQMWYNTTNVYLTLNSSSQINVYAYYYGNTDWDGISYMNPAWSFPTYDYGNIQLNRTDMDYYNDIRKKLVVCHEFGHQLGLDHVSDYVIMYGNDVYEAYLNNNSLQYAPSQDDINGVNSLY